MKTLIAQLTEATQDLKEQFISRTKEWAESDYVRISERLTWKEADWCQAMGITPEVKNAGKPNEFLGFPRNFHNTKDARALDRMKSEVRRVTTWGLEEYVAREVKSAEIHYNQSIEKLAYRLNKKGVVDGSEFEITSARVGVNFECRIQHGNKVTKAWTIVAEGAIQRPHYRYLVK